MAEKIKILKKGVSILNKNLELDPEVFEKIVVLQEKRQKEFQSRIDLSNKEALDRYEKRLVSLKEAKTNAINKFDEEIQTYQELISNMKTANAGVRSAKKSSKTKPNK